MALDEPKPLLWRGSSKAGYMAFPPDVQREMGYALFLATVHLVTPETGLGMWGTGLPAWQPLPKR